MDAIDRHEVLRGPSTGIATIRVRCHVIFSVALVSQRQLMASLWAGVRTVIGQRTSMYAVGVTLRVSRKRCSELLDDVDQDNVAPTSMQHYQLDCYKCRGLRECRSIRHVCIP
jgi:hypothetical protein